MTDAADLRRYRPWLVVVVAVAVVAKTLIAARTFGSNDVTHWEEFAAGVRSAGPVGVYGLHFPLPYNHPPLIGYLLVVLNGASTHTALSFPLAIRLPAIAADAVTPFLLLAMVGRRRPPREAFAAAVLVAVSPVLLVISAYHGNTDPVFVMLTLAAVYLLADRQAPLLAGVVLGLALSVKIVPVVVVPVLLLAALLSGRRALVRFAAGLVSLLVVVWGPAVLSQWGPLHRDVLGYAGIGARQWGLVQLTSVLGLHGLGDWLAGSGRFLVLVLAAGIPAYLLWRRPGRLAECAALALVLFWFLSPAFATQYFVWMLAPAYLLTFWGATAYNLLAGALLVEVYTRWSGGLPWGHAQYSPLGHGEVVVAFCCWLVVGAIAVLGWRRCVQPSTAVPAGQVASGS